MTEVLLINPNIVYPVDAAISGRAIPIREIEKVVNLGLLSIASYLHAKDISVELMDLVGHFDDEEQLRQAIETVKPKIIGLSCISCYGYPRLIEYTEIIKGIDDNIFIMAGGQHILGIPKTAMQEAPLLDCVVRGEGEQICYQIVTHLQNRKSLKDIPSIAYRDNGEIVDNTGVFGQVTSLDALTFLKYDLYPNFQEYAPHVEISRNCSFSCNFCTAAFVEGGIRYKELNRFIDEIEYVKSLYNNRPDLKFFFACSNFGMKKTRTEELIRLFKERNVNIAWRTQTRVDTSVVNYLEELVDVGLAVLDLGLESASPTVLKLMNKTKNGKVYLSKAREFIKRAGAVDNLLLKVNLVLYAGETPDTVRETTNFMLEHASYIDGLSVGPVMVYANTPLGHNLAEYESKYGTTVVKGLFWDKVHAYQVNPSAHFSYDQLNAFAHILSKMLSPERKYFEIKSHGQYPLNMSFEDFKIAVGTQDRHNLPFNFD
jgi:radical SAM superfamily enzyme YgiQ (UPF0313 family)